MPESSPFPAYPRKPHRSGQARIRVGGRDLYLGIHGSPESHAEYARRKAEYESGQVPEPVLRAGPRLTVADGVALFLEQAQSHQLRHPDGTPKKEHAEFVYAARPLLDLFGPTLAADFRARQLAALQGEMRTRGWSPRQVNHQVVRVRHIFRWLESQELVPEGRWDHLRTVRGLRVGNVDVLPVPEPDLDATLPVLHPTLRAAVEVQMWTGARPSEVLRLRRGDVQTSGRVELERGVWLTLGKCWAAVLAEHKTAYAGHGRVLLFGPKAQAALAPVWDRPTEAYLFDPREAAAPHRRAQRTRPVLDHWRVDCYTAAIGRAAKKAGVPAWGAYRLRHNAATRLAAEFGPDLARIVLGQRDLRVTRAYVLDDVQAAVDAMGEAG